MIIVYNKELTNFHEINHALSIQMEEHYNAIGKAIITLPIDDYNISLLKMVVLSMTQFGICHL